ncbi:hypothetical protein BFW89_27465 [Pseudomonas synxantha]|nr:hypothetical protein BFW89_27465 [Pseudomonas synxantha]
MGQASRELQKLSEATGTAKASERVVEAELRKLAHSPEGQGIAPEFARDTLDKLLANMPNAYTAGAAAAAPNFFEVLEDMIGFIKKDYLAVYENALKKYSDFYKRFNEEVMSKMGSWVKGKNDGKEVELSIRRIGQALGNLIYDSTRKDYFLYTAASKQDAEKWAAAMGLPSSSVIKSGAFVGGVKWVVVIDVSPLTTMQEEVKKMGDYFSADGLASVDSSKFQAWQTGFNSQESELKNQLQMFTTKYGNANSYHENFNKILSSQLSQYAEMLKNIAAAIG